MITPPLADRPCYKSDTNDYSLFPLLAKYRETCYNKGRLSPLAPSIFYTRIGVLSP